MNLQFKDDAKVFKALCDENRLYILSLLESGEKCGSKLLEVLHIGQPTLSHHMKILCDAGVVNGRKDGKWVYYSINTNGATHVRELLGKYTTVQRLQN